MSTRPNPSTSNGFATLLQVAQYFVFSLSSYKIQFALCCCVRTISTTLKMAETSSIICCSSVVCRFLLTTAKNKIVLSSKVSPTFVILERLFDVNNWEVICATLHHLLHDLRHVDISKLLHCGVPHLQTFSKFAIESETLDKSTVFRSETSCRGMRLAPFVYSMLNLRMPYKMRSRGMWYIHHLQLSF